LRVVQVFKLQPRIGCCGGAAFGDDQFIRVGIPADRERSFRRIVNTHSDLS
jgi:hypothetical protein